MFLFGFIFSVVSWGQTLIISEVADPGDNYDARFVELYNATDNAIDLSAENYYLSRQANAGTIEDIELTGTIDSGATYIIAYSDSEFNSAYGFEPDQASGYISGNGDDGYFLYSGGDHTTGTLIDAYGVIDEDGTGEDWEYEDSHAIRNSNVCSANTTWTASEWTITSADVADMTPGTHTCDCPTSNDRDAYATDDLANQPAAGNIDSTYNTDSEAVDVFVMDIYDQGSGDGLPTKITKIRIKPYTTNTADWTDNIQGFVIDDGNDYITPASIDITDSYIDFNFDAGDLDVPDNDVIELNFAVYLNTSNIEDGEILSFMVDADDHGFTSDSSGSGFESTFPDGDFNSNDFTISVEATDINFLQQPSDVSGNTAITPPVIVAFCDVNGNVDVDYDGDGYGIGLTTTGSFASSATTEIDATSGIATFDNLIFDEAGENITLSTVDVDDWGLVTHTSNEFNVSGNPEISVEGNNIEIPDGETTPSTDDNTDFGNVEVDGGTQAYNFVIKNLGNVNLTINSISSDNSEFTVSGTTSETIAAGDQISFIITFDPADLGTRTATISIDNDDSDENPYDFVVQGNGINSALSDIVTNADFIYTDNISYLSYQASPIESTNGSVGVFKFDIRDGGENGDADTVGTELTDIVFSLGSAHGAYILDAALFDEDNLLVNNPTVDAANGTITFAGLSGADFTADDDSVKSITLRVSFTDNVTDNEQLQFTVTSATANSEGSLFVASNAGGAQSSVSGDDNRIEVVADRIRFDEQPQDQVKNTDLTAFSIIAVDENDIKDLDAINEIDLTTSATGTMTHSSPYTMSGGEASITDVQFDTPQTDVTITATTSGLNYDNDDVSEPFDILDISDGSYRSVSDGTWEDESDDTTASWEQFVNGEWTAIDDQPPLDTSNTVYIYHNITLVGSNSASDIVIENGGTIDTNGVSQTITNLLVRNGGTYFKNSNGMSVADSGEIEVEDGGTFKFLHTDDTSLSDNLWNGTEKFHQDSNFIIVRTDSTSDFQFMNDAGDVSEYDGGIFGNLIIDQSEGNLMLLPDNFSGTLTKGDLIIKNLADNIKFTKTDASCTIKGNLEIQSSVIKDITITTCQCYFKC